MVGDLGQQACDLTSRRCVPCEGGVAPLDAAAAGELLGQLRGWALGDGRLRKRWRFGDFAAAMRFVNRMAEIAEEEGHHPDFSVHYDQVDVELSTHAIGGLSENDFILAAKLDAIDPAPGP